jgi:hypothetical protein
MGTLIELARWSMIADIVATFAMVSFYASALVILLLWRSKVVHDKNQGSK